jgi:hypothetical protein
MLHADVALARTRTAHSQAALTFVMRPTTAHRLTPAHPAWRPRAVNAL